MSDSTVKEGLWVYKLNCFAPLGLNSMEIEMQIDS